MSTENCEFFNNCSDMPVLRGNSGKNNVRICVSAAAVKGGRIGAFGAA